LKHGLIPFIAQNGALLVHYSTTIGKNKARKMSGRFREKYLLVFYQIFSQLHQKCTISVLQAS
jgi:hypothetical protein